MSGLQDLSLSQTLDVFGLLTQTYPRYVDTLSRDAVEAIGVELVKRDELRGESQAEDKLGITEQILGWLSNEVGRISKRGSSRSGGSVFSIVLLTKFHIYSASSYAPADIFVLLSWSCGLYTVCMSCNPRFSSTQCWKALTSALSSLFDLLMAESTGTKASMRKSGLTRVRRALRSVYLMLFFYYQRHYSQIRIQAPNHLSTLLSVLLAKAEANQESLRLVPLIGVAIDVNLRLKNIASTSLSVEIKVVFLSL